MSHARRSASFGARILAAGCVVVGLAGAGEIAARPSGPPPSAGASAQGWQTYRSAEGGFSVSMPCTPTRDTKSQDTDIGPIAMYIASCATTSLFATVIYYDVPAAVSKTPERLLADTADGFMKGGGFVEKAERHAVTINGSPGLEIIGESADGSAVVQARYYLVRGRVYLLMVGTPASDVASPEIGDFFASFKLG